MTVHVVQPALPAYRVPLFRALGARLADRGLSLRVYASSRDQLGVTSVEPDGFEAEIGVRMRCFIGRRALVQPRLNVRLARGDVLVINGNPRILSNYPLWLRAASLGVPVIWWGHGWTAGSHGVRAAIRHRMMRVPDALMLYTDAERATFLEKGFADDRVFALNNGVDVAAIDAAITSWTPESLGRFRIAHGIDRLPHWCVFLGRLTPKSRIDLLVEALPMIRADTGLVVVGDGPMLEGARRRARELSVDARIVWAGAQYEESCVAPWMLSSSMFVYPGSVGLSLIHAFAYGLPAVVHDRVRDHMPEIAAFERGQNGMSFSNGSSLSLAATVNELIKDVETRRRMAVAAKTLVHRTYNVQDMARRFEEAVISTLK